MADVRAGFGEGLRTERERRGVSLASLSAQTKVNPRHLEALEQGDYKVLPGGVFRRGIVRAYLASVGLDEHEWMPRFQASYEAHARALGVATEADPEGWATFAANVKKNRTQPKPRLTWRWLGVLALFLIVLAGAWAVWHFLLRGRMQPWG